MGFCCRFGEHACVVIFRHCMMSLLLFLVVHHSAVDDGKLEVVGISGAFHMVREQVT